MDTLYLGGKVLFGGIGDLLYFINKDPVLMRIPQSPDYKPKLSIWNNRTEEVKTLFDENHFSSIVVNEKTHEPMMRARSEIDVPEIIKDRDVSPYPVPMDGFKRPEGTYFVCHLESEEGDNQLEVLPSLLGLMGKLTKKIPVYVIGTGDKEYKFPENFIDYRGKTSIPQAYHMVKESDGFVGLTSSWYLLSLMLKKRGWSFNSSHDLQYSKMNRL